MREGDSFTQITGDSLFSGDQFFQYFFARPGRWEKVLKCTKELSVSSTQILFAKIDYPIG